MDLSSVFPILDQELTAQFQKCASVSDFLNQVIVLYGVSTDLRTQQACRSVFMAFRDHYPSYVAALNPEQQEIINKSLQQIDGKIIKLRRIVLSQLSKVA